MSSSLLITANGDNAACTGSSAVAQKLHDSVSYRLWHAVDSEDSEQRSTTHIITQLSTNSASCY